MSLSHPSDDTTSETSVKYMCDSVMTQAYVIRCIFLLSSIHTLFDAFSQLTLSLFVSQRRVPVENPFAARPDVADPSVVPEVSGDFAELQIIDI